MNRSPIDRRRRVAARCALVGLVSCGSSGSGISSPAVPQLQLRVAAIRASAAAGDRSEAETQLAKFRVDVVQFRADDKVDDAAAARILRAADAVQTELALLEPRRPRLRRRQPTTSTEPPNRRTKGHGKGDKRGGKGD